MAWSSRRPDRSTRQGQDHLTTACTHNQLSPLHQTGASSSQTASAIKRRLLFDLRNGVEVSDPALCRAKPELLFRDELVALASGAHADSADFRPFPNSAGIDRCPAFGA